MRLAPQASLTRRPAGPDAARYDRVWPPPWSVPGFDFALSAHILADMWSKWVFIATVGAFTCLMRGAVGEIVAQSGGDKLGPAFLAEATAIASANGYPIADAQVSNTSATVTQAGSDLTSSMYRDVIDGHPTESGPILGDLVARGGDHGIEIPALQPRGPAASRPQRPRQLGELSRPFPWAGSWYKERWPTNRG